MTHKLISLLFVAIPFSTYAGDDGDEQKIILSPTKE